MRRFWLFVFLGLSLPAAAAEPVEARLIRTVQIGSPQDISVGDILRVAKDSESNYEQHVLARSALVVLGEDRGFPEWPLERLLDRALSLLARSTHAFQPPDGLPDSFDSEDLIFTVVYALAVSGHIEQATDVLERHLSTDSDFKRGVVLQSLRNLGTPRATELVQRFAERGDDRNLAENLLADLYYPFLEDLHKHLHLIPPAERARENLLRLANEPCTRRGALAIYFLGFLPEGDDPIQAKAEVALLREMTHAPCFHNRFFAIRSLALRSPESLAFWNHLYAREDDAWQRDQLVRICFARFGRDFLPLSLRMLEKERAQYVQWELMHGNIEMREHGRFRDYWDIWLPPTLQFRLNFAAGWGRLSEPDRDELLRWLENGAAPRDPWVRNHMFYALARSVEGRHTRRLLRLFNNHPERNANWWILTPLGDPQALPLLRYWLTLDSEENQREQLANLIERLETPGDDTRKSGRGDCCRPTRECLLARVQLAVADAEVIQSEDEALAWLAATEKMREEPKIIYRDSLERVADVSWPGTGKTERWEHLFGCWRRVETGSDGF